MAGNRPPAAFRPQKDLIAEETFEPKHLQEVLPLSVSGTGCGFGFSLAKSAKSIWMARCARHPSQNKKGAKYTGKLSCISCLSRLKKGV
jgi:hypothetical protein